MTLKEEAAGAVRNAMDVAENGIKVNVEHSFDATETASTWPTLGEVWEWGQANPGKAALAVIVGALIGRKLLR